MATDLENIQRLLDRFKKGILTASGTFTPTIGRRI